MSGTLTGIAEVDTGLKFLNKETVAPYVSTKSRYEGTVDDGRGRQVLETRTRSRGADRGERSAEPRTSGPSAGSPAGTSRHAGDARAGAQLLTG